MYSPSPPPVAASNAYVYLNHQQSLASNPYASHAQSTHHLSGGMNASSMGDMGLVGGASSAAALSSGPPASSAYGNSSPFGAMNSPRYDTAGMGWLSRFPPQQSHLAQSTNGTPVGPMPAALNHGVPSSPGYSGMGSSPHMSVLGSTVSPATPQTQTQSTRAASSAGTSSEWQQQIYCADISRQSYSPHHHARAAALAARSSVNAGQDSKKGIQLPAGAAANGLSFPLRGDGKGGDESFSGLSTSPSKSAGLRTSKANDEEASEQSWSMIDMGGLNLKTIGNEVFRYTFLTSLFINHNSITTLSPAVVQLRNLSVLDASGNKLVMIPPELGMLTELRGLFLFDNCLTVLPPELGTLYQLEMLGIEGNPLQENLMSIIQHEGTQALIAFLRDSCPVPVPPPEREWITLEADVPSMSEEESANNTFAVLSYNVLCEKYATPQMYGYTPGWALVWDYRKEFILQEIMSYGADICCLQELEMGQYEEYFEPKLQQNDYEGLFWPKSRARTMREDERRHVDGCATFFNSRVYRLVDKQLIEFNQLALQRPDFKKTEDIFNRVMTKDNVAAIAMLEHRKTGAKLLLANAHMHWDPAFRDVKMVQTAMLMEQLESISNRFAKMPSQVKLEGNATPPKYTSGKQIPMVICGDFNSTPDSGVYEFLSQGTAAPDHEDFMDHTYGTYTSEGLRHSCALRSAYNSIGELPLTNHTPGFRGAIDYIWYSTNTLAASGLLGEVDATYLSRVVGFPNAHFPSEYVAKLTPVMYVSSPSSKSSRPRHSRHASAHAWPTHSDHTLVAKVLRTLFL